MSSKPPTVFIQPLSVWCLLLIIIISVCNASEINSSLTLSMQEEHHQHTEILNYFPKVTLAEQGTLLGFPEPQDKACIGGLLFSGTPERHLTRTFVPSGSWVKDKK